MKLANGFSKRGSLFCPICYRFRYVTEDFRRAAFNNAAALWYTLLIAKS